ncbi:hypothetical protein [Gracilibacillus salinarum]|uniref:Uncharacterized protein n=1 Tax=Gracilibacillus salinarum TaxID=2932255 RepID=A0ABY4GNL3_9BACI|nr:hypothetical protein [Gracilibacillus salinarum]UOQ85755.1 hypothetical protein MUN87_02270 [Gracilibacillus salinarum]
MKKKLNKIYHEDWQVIKEYVKPLEFQIERNKQQVLLRTNALTLVTRKQVK